jgi:transmembrane 9 superfamily protein 3
MLLTANLFPLLCFSIASVLNTIAIGYHSLAAVPFGSIVVVLLIWMFLSFPLCLFGTVRLSSTPLKHPPDGCNLSCEL